MHVDVDQARVERDGDGKHRMAPARQVVGIGAAHRAEQLAVAHGAAVDRDELVQPVGAVEGRQRGEARHARAAALARDRQHVVGELRSQHVDGAAACGIGGIDGKDALPLAVD